MLSAVPLLQPTLATNLAPLSPCAAQGWVSVTPVGLLSDIPLTADSASARAQPRAVQALAAALAAAAAHLGVDAGGIPDGMLAAAGGKQDAAAPVLAAGAAS